MNTKRISFILGAIIGTAVAVQTASADTFSFTTTGTAVVQIDTTNGTPPSNISLSGSSASGLNGGDVVTQNLNFYSGYDGAAGPVPFTLTEDVTLTDETTMMSETQTIMISGQEIVSPTTDPDTVQLFAGPTTVFSTLGVGFMPIGQSFFDNPPFPGGTLTGTFSATITPEPSTYGFMVSGLAGIAFMMRRKSAK